MAILEIEEVLVEGPPLSKHLPAPLYVISDEKSNLYRVNGTLFTIHIHWIRLLGQCGGLNSKVVKSPTQSYLPPTGVGEK